MKDEKYFDSMVSGILNENKGYTTTHEPKFSEKEKEVYEYINTSKDTNRLNKIKEQIERKISKLEGDQDDADSTTMG